MGKTIHSILFTRPNVAEYLETQLPDMGETSVLIRTEFSALSAGTERANLTGEKNIASTTPDLPVVFPRQLGYSSVGIVEEIGARVTSVKPGDRVIAYFGKHNSYNLLDEKDVLNISGIQVDPKEAAMVVIAGFPTLGIRRTRLEMGESVMIFGLGILGQFAVQLARISGAVPVLAADLHPERRALALELGADAVFDPRDEDFIDQVKAHTNDGKGTNVVVEVTGAISALDQAFHVVAPFGRISLLGCTRQPVPQVDFYHNVHGTGVTLVGTNNFARATLESQPGNWTWQDDCRALLRLAEGGRLKIAPVIGGIASPEEAPAIYERLAFHPEDFPIGMVFDWRK